MSDNWLGLSHDEICATSEYDEGYKAGYAGKLQNDCPYPPDPQNPDKHSPSSWLWTMGYCNGYGQKMFDTDDLNALVSQ